MGKSIKRVSKRETRPARDRASEILQNVHNGLHSIKHKDTNKNFSFDSRIVGSAKNNTCLKVDGRYDVDYQMIINKSFNDYSANEIHKIFTTEFDKYLHKNEKKDDSTSVLTIHHSISQKYDGSKQDFSIDFAIIRLINGNAEIIRRNEQNNYVWNKLKRNNNEVYEYFDSLKSNEQRIIIENYVLPIKEKNVKLPEDNPNKKKSYQIFIEGVNNYRHEANK